MYANSLVFWHIDFRVYSFSWGPSNFQMDSIILQNSKFQGPVDRMKKPSAGTLTWLLLDLEFVTEIQQR